MQYAIIDLPLGLEARQFGDIILWSPGTWLNTRTSYTPIFNGPSEQLYTIEIKTNSGCVTVDTQLVKTIKNVEIYVPTAFTPNNDGLNDLLRPILMGVKELHYFRIFNRWGQLLFETKSDRAGWDGRLQGIPQTAQVVVWMIEGVGVDNNIYRRKGHQPVSAIRIFFIHYCNSNTYSPVSYTCFFALLIACFVVGLGVQMPVAGIIDSVKDGFGNIMRSLGLIIVLGTTLGVILEHTGSTKVMAAFILKKVGEKHAQAKWLMSITGFIVGLPVFCDSGIYCFERTETGLWQNAPAFRCRHECFSCYRFVGSALFDSSASGCGCGGSYYRRWILEN